MWGAIHLQVRVKSRQVAVADPLQPHMLSLLPPPSSAFGALHSMQHPETHAQHASSDAPNSWSLKSDKQGKAMRPCRRCVPVRNCNVVKASRCEGRQSDVLVLCRYYTPAWEAGTTYSHKAHSGAAVNAASTGHHPAAPLADPAAAAALQHTMLPTGSESQKQVQHPSKGSLALSQAAGSAAGLGQGLSTERSFYSFEMGGVHFLMLNTEAPSDPDSPQGRFVAADLAQV